MTRVLFPLWQMEKKEYEAICAYLGLTPSVEIYAALLQHLLDGPFRCRRPRGFPLFLAGHTLTRFRVSRLDMGSKLFFSDHPIRHRLNGVIGLHECTHQGYRELAAAPQGWMLLPSLMCWSLQFVWSFVITVPWLCWQFLLFLAGSPFRTKTDLSGKRVLITGTGRGLGMDLMLQCLEQGAAVIGTTRNRESLAELCALLPPDAPVKILIADLSRSGALVTALRDSKVSPNSLDIAILCAGIKHSGESVLSEPQVRDTFQVNFFSAIEFARWLCVNEQPASKTSPVDVIAETDSAMDPRTSKAILVLVSSMGRWHGMHFSSGYNASKAALSIWAESLEMEAPRSGDRRLDVMIVEPGVYESGMMARTKITKLLFASRRKVARQIVAGILMGQKVMRPPFWFALLTWGLCLSGHRFRNFLFVKMRK